MLAAPKTRTGTARWAGRSPGTGANADAAHAADDRMDDFVEVFARRLSTGGSEQSVLAAAAAAAAVASAPPPFDPTAAPPIVITPGAPLRIPCLHPSLWNPTMCLKAVLDELRGAMVAAQARVGAAAPWVAGGGAGGLGGVAWAGAGAGRGPGAVVPVADEDDDDDL